MWPSRIAATIISRICACSPTLLWKERWISWFHISGIGHRASGIRYQVSGIRYQGPVPACRGSLAHRAGPVWLLVEHPGLALERHMMDQPGPWAERWPFADPSDPCPLIPVL